MKLSTNTIGNVDEPTADDICRAFANREKWDWADVAGNICELLDDRGNTIQSVSGDFYKNFTLFIRFESDIFRMCNRAFSRDEVLEYFLRFHRGDNSWTAELSWEEQPSKGMIANICEMAKRIKNVKYRGSLS